MKRLWGHVGAGASIVGLATGVCAGCAHNDSTIFIRSVLAPKFQTTGMLCQYNSDPSQAFIWSGVLDIALRQQYDAVFLAASQLLPLANSSQLRTETSAVTIRGAIIKITDSQGRQLSTFTRLTSALLNPAAAGTPVYQTVAVTIVDPNTLVNSPDIQNNIAAAPLGRSGVVRWVTYTRLFGNTLGGQSVESDEFEFPVDICNGCLINFTNSSAIAATTTTPAIPLTAPNCAALTGTQGASSAAPQIPCLVGEDIPVDCAGCQELTSCRGAYPNGLPTH